jgi:hypothetical protein
MIEAAEGFFSGFYLFGGEFIEPGD